MSSTPFADLIKQAGEAKYKVIPTDTYAVVCKGATATMSSTGKPMLKLNVKTLLGPHKDAGLITQQTLTAENPVAVAMFLKFLAAFGIEEDFLISLPPAPDGGPNMVELGKALVGRAAMAEVSIGEWDGEDRNNIDKFKKPNPEQKAAIEQALGALGESSAFAAPKAPPADPFGATAPTSTTTPAGAAGGLVDDKPAEEPF